MSSHVERTDVPDKLSITLTAEDQIRQFLNARDAVKKHADEGDVDPERWGGDIKNGEVVRLTCCAYTGTGAFGDE